MSNENFDEMLEASLKNVYPGLVLDGTVISVRPDQIILNIGYKSDGVITRENFTNHPNVDLTTWVKVGDVIKCKVKKINDGEGQVVLSKKDVVSDLANGRIKQAYESGEVVKGLIFAIVNGGVKVEPEFGGVVFIPGSLLVTNKEENIQNYKNKEIEFIITEFNEEKHRIVGSRTKVLQNQKEERIKQAISNLHVGDRVKAKVSNIVAFGVFCDIGGIDGLVHVSELDWGKTYDKKKQMNVGDELTVLIKGIDPVTNKVSLSLKFPEEDPWLGAEDRFKVGQVIKGTVQRLDAKNGAFVQIAPYIDGLIRKSEISTKKYNKLEDVLQVGQELDVMIIEVDLSDEKKRIGLSLKALMEDKKATETVEEKVEEVSAPEETKE